MANKSNLSTLKEKFGEKNAKSQKNGRKIRKIKKIHFDFLIAYSNEIPKKPSNSFFELVFK